MNRYLISLVFALTAVHGYATEIEAEVSGGLAFDSNVYRAPDDSYQDFFADTTGATIVDPDKKSGFFIPFKASVSMLPYESERFSINTDYSLDVTQYLKSENQNADEITNEIELGATFPFKDAGNTHHKIYIGPNFTDVSKTYYDRDTGLKKVSGAPPEEVDERYSYFAYGSELSYTYEHDDRGSLELSYLYESRDHDTTTAGFQYDNDRAQIGLSLDFRLSKNTNLYFDHERTNVEYDDRHARLLDGRLLASSPLLEYNYVSTRMRLSQRLTNDLRLRTGFKIQDRTDEFLGYNDYDYSELFLQLAYRASRTILVKAELSSWERDYPNAWNFDRDPSSFPAILDTDHTNSDGSDISLNVSKKLNKQLELEFDTEISNTNHSDPRYDYGKQITMVMLNWTL